MQLKAITNYLESLAPRSSQESYDNSGLIVGNPFAEIQSVLICLDSTEEVVDEAIRKGCNLIIAHHPIVFKGLKSLTGKSYVERVVMKCIKHDINLYAIHTNLDNYRFGVNFEIGSRLRLKNLKVLSPAEQVLQKLVVFIPNDSVAAVSQAVFSAGAGTIGDYSACSFEVQGTGGFTPEKGANPAIGKEGQREQVQETRFECIISRYQAPAIIHAMLQAHPYEEVAYDLLTLSNSHSYEGAGMIGELEQPIETTQFLEVLKTIFHCGTIRHTSLVKTQIQRVAFCGGAGSFLLPHAKAAGADIFITGDFKYHEFFDAENQLIIADIGHYESEQFTINLLEGILKKKFPTFAVHLTEVNTNPVNYF